MAKKKRPGLKAPTGMSVRSSDSTATGLSAASTRGNLSRGRSTRSGMSRSTHYSGDARSVGGMSTHTSRSGHGDARSIGGRSGASGSGGDWDDEGGNNSSSHPLSKTGQSMRSFLKSANSVSSGLGLSGPSTHRLTHKQKKARPGLAIAPQGLSSLSGHSRHDRSGHRAMSSRNVLNKSGHRSPTNSDHGSNDGTGGRPMKKQMSMRSMGSAHSGHGGGARSVGARSAHSRGGDARSVASRDMARSGHSPSRHSRFHSSRHVPQPPGGDGGGHDSFYGDGYDGFEEAGMEEEVDYYPEDEDQETLVMPQTEEEIRKGLHTEHVTKGFFRKKVRSIKWYSADIDKVDAGNFEAQETIDEESEYETDSSESEEMVDPDPWYIALGRGLLLLEKKGEETTSIKRWLRFLTWLTFICDATAAIVTLVQFTEVQTCCGEPILNLGGINVNWEIIIRYATIFYLVLILLEVYPVLRRGFPFNIVNPMIGFLISFALFFDDSYMEALIMWCIETCAVLAEFAAYRVKIRQVNLRHIEIKKLMPKTTKKKESFEDEDDYLRELHKARRRYYVLKQEQRMDQRLLQYLHVAVYMNIVMSSIILMLILVIARNGGLCIENYNFPNPFKSNQYGRCNLCADGPSEFCEICNYETETFQCYFPYE